MYFVKSIHIHISLYVFFQQTFKSKNLVVVCSIHFKSSVEELLLSVIFCVLSKTMFSWQTNWQYIEQTSLILIVPHPFSNLCLFLLLTGSCTSSLSPIRTRLRRWGTRLSRFRTRRVKPQLVGYATKPSLLMAVATSVHIAKRNSVLGAEDECLCGQIR